MGLVYRRCSEKSQAHMIKSFLEIGKNIVVDSTNLKNNSLFIKLL